MASGKSNKGNKEYEKKLRQLMQTCLPPILAEIVDRRPQDPIEYLSEQLYKFRTEKAKDSKTMSASGPRETDNLVPPNATHHAGSQPKPSVRVVNRTSANTAVGVRMVQDDCGDEGLGEVREELYDISANMVHMSEEPNLVAIGDVFDDSDIT